jgi:type I restriction enzyme S subunit
MSEGLPQGWVECTFENLKIFALGGDWGKSPADALDGWEQVTVLRGTEFRNWYFDKGNTGALRIVKKQSLLSRKLELNDLVIEISGGGPSQPVGRTLFIDELSINSSNYPLICSNFCRKVRLSSAIETKYVYNCLNYQYSRGYFDKYQNSSTNIRNLQFDQFCEGVLIPLPPLNEQKRIVAKLDAIMPRIEAVKARLDKVPGILKRLRQSVLTAAVTGKLTEQWRQEHPEVGEWEEAQLSDLSELITKGASPTWQGINYVESPEVLFVTSENVYTRELRLEQKKYVELAFNQKQQRSILRKGDLLTNIVGASIGRTAVYDLDSLANVNQAVAIIRLRNQKEIPFYLYYLNCPEYLDKLNKEKVDVARANISLTDLKNMLVPHPQLSEQKEIVRQVDKLFALADKVETHYQKAKARVDKLSQSVLAKAFRGELVPQDPNDLPAAELLKQILAEKDKMAAQLKKRKTKNVKQRK